MTILITGAAGFVGRHLKEQLMADYPESNIATISSFPSKNPLEIVRSGGEIKVTKSNQEILDGVKCVIHLGSYTPKNQSEINEFGLALESINFTSKLLGLSLPNVQRMIYSSTMDVYSKTEKAISELSETSNSNSYTMMKLFTESMIHHHCNINKISLKTLRIGHLYGLGDEVYDKIIPKLLSSVLNKQNNEMNLSLDQILNLMYVKDAARIISELVAKSDLAGVSNLVSSKPTTIRELIQIIEVTTGQKFIYKAQEIALKYRQLKFCVSNLVGEVDYRETPLEEGLAEMYTTERS